MNISWETSEQPVLTAGGSGVAKRLGILARSGLTSAVATWLPAAVLVTLAVASGLWLAAIGQPQGQSARFTGRAPDLTMEEFEVTTMGEDGNPLRRLSAAYMAHFNTTGTKELRHPHLVVYRSGSEPWHIASERGWISADNDVLMLLGRVDIWRNYPQGRREIHIETEDLRVLPDVEFAETALPVAISTPESLTRGVGMRAYLGENRVQLLSRVKTTIEPLQR
ncbi:MAG: LPS export ABC transporter periplasmic protein LptC [Gammaproteobacteria bacterium]|nr:LPS export ABC transporter periplasmic protein LptC [Gammaproteobacteria bacterium]NIO23956.1 LPS export ABC transporter periplasmic protein LptC [Gammaproteobacteria bacterium]NIP47328.1 LPS export ABC transporter periplasmic protein LptC [Gammaproteobacteria bacterium]NIP63390.1 LPS export ABC transporter periplasmic protein LptC [Gammaproteobacteria bacterium]NIP89526.1 LPS export ABC transporter periplasmic protein LptC [Gammaproteobacteria bacterium]